MKAESETPEFVDARNTAKEDLRILGFNHEARAKRVLRYVESLEALLDEEPEEPDPALWPNMMLLCEGDATVYFIDVVPDRSCPQCGCGLSEVSVWDNSDLVEESPPRSDASAQMLAEFRRPACDKALAYGGRCVLDEGHEGDCDNGVPF